TTMQLIGVENPAPSVCSANISGCSPSVRMTITLPFGLTTQSMNGGCIPCSRHCLRTSRSSSSIFLCPRKGPEVLASGQRTRFIGSLQRHEGGAGRPFFMKFTQVSCVNLKHPAIVVPKFGPDRGLGIGAKVAHNVRWQFWHSCRSFAHGWLRRPHRTSPKPGQQLSIVEFHWRVAFLPPPSSPSIYRLV